MRININQKGNFDPLLIPLVLAIVLLLAVSGFGIWSYTNYLDASETEQAEIDEAVAAAEVKLTEDLELAFAEREKLPTKTYTGPAAAGAVKIVYPKTWSVHSKENEEQGEVDSYFNPEFVRDTRDKAPVALRMSVSNSLYENEIKIFTKKAERGEVKVVTYKSNGQTGIRVDGNVEDDFTGSMVILPIRDKTLKIWTENTAFTNDFNDIVLKNLKFNP